MVIVMNEKKDFAESSASVQLIGQMEEILNTMYANTVSNASTGEIPMDKAVAIVTSKMVDAVIEWVHRRRDGKGQYLLAKYTSFKNSHQYDKTLDNRLYGMETVLTRAKGNIENFQK
jgi:hypothetical protein